MANLYEHFRLVALTNTKVRFVNSSHQTWSLKPRENTCIVWNRMEKVRLSGKQDTNHLTLTKPAVAGWN